MDVKEQFPRYIAPSPPPFPSGASEALEPVYVEVGDPTDHVHVKAIKLK